MIVRNGDIPLVICSGWSENAFKNPLLFFSRYRRTMKASADVGVTLAEDVKACREDYPRLVTYLSA